MKNLFPSLPDNPGLAAVFDRFPTGVAALRPYLEDVLRKDAPLSIAERELIAAYVSALNACQFCLNSHAAFARGFGVSESLLATLIEDREHAGVDPKLQPLLSYVEILTKTPSKLTEAHAQAVYDAGWSEDALYCAIQTCAVFCMMNRIVEGTGCVPQTAPGSSIRKESYLD